MLTYKENKYLQSYSNKLLALNSQIQLGTNTLTPLNYKEEKEKFLTSDTYNPQFYYQKQNTSFLQAEITTLTEELRSFKISKELYYHLYNYLESLNKGIEAVQNVGTSEFSNSVNKIFSYESFDGKDFLKKMQTIVFNDPGNCKLKNAEEMADIFRSYITNLDLDYSVKVDSKNDHIIRVDPQSLIIGAKVKRFCNNIQRLITHEIDSHILQRHNLSNAQNSLLRLIPSNESLLWGEGLAVYNEIHSGLITKGAFETYYYRLKAVEMLHKSFREIFDYLLRYVKPEKAYMITYRVKRGMGDTSLPGGYSKDASYALGYLTVDTYIKSGGCIEMLYISRVPLIGQLLIDEELLTPTSILLPKYLRTKTQLPKSSPAASIFIH